MMNERQLLIHHSSILSILFLFCFM